MDVPPWEGDWSEYEEWAENGVRRIIRFLRKSDDGDLTVHGKPKDIDYSVKFTSPSLNFLIKMQKDMVSYWLFVAGFLGHLFTTIVYFPDESFMIDLTIPLKDI